MEQNEITNPETAHSKKWRVANDKGYFRHGGPYDRGHADFYYGRPRSPHYFKGATYRSPKVTMKEMSKAQKDAYHAGFNDALWDNDRKDYL